MGDDFDAARFARSFESFLERFREALPRAESPVRTRIAAHLGVDPADLPTSSEPLAPTEHANLQLALDALRSDATSWELVGLPAELQHYGELSLASLASGRFRAATEPCAPEYVNQPVDVDRTLPCIRLGLFLVTVAGAPVAALVSFGDHHGARPGLRLDVLATDLAAASRFVARVRALMHERNVYRGKLLSFAFSEWGGFGVQFHTLPAVTRDDIVLPERDLDAIERHTIGMSRYAGALRAAGRHLKRGLLLYGPPGTGKTLAVMYLCARMPERTTLLLGGPGVGALGQAIALARRLQPSMIVLEDVDLVAMERTRPGMGTNPLLFQLLDAIDGLADDADVVFVLTTNRVELLEPALAARPGRIDQAIETRLPDADARRRLLALHLRGIPHEEDLEPMVERTAGVAPSFIKELVRRAVLAAAERDDAHVQVRTADLGAALDDLAEHSAPVLRTALGGTPAIAATTDADRDVSASGPAGGWSAHPAPFHLDQ